MLDAVDVEDAAPVVHVAAVDVEADVAPIL